MHASHACRRQRRADLGPGAALPAGAQVVQAAAGSSCAPPAAAGPAATGLPQKKPPVLRITLRSRPPRPAPEGAAGPAEAGAPPPSPPPSAAAERRPGVLRSLAESEAVRLRQQIEAGRDVAAAIDALASCQVQTAPAAWWLSPPAQAPSVLLTCMRVAVPQLSVGVLRASGVALAVKPLRNDADAALSTAASALIARWKAQLKEEKRGGQDGVPASGAAGRAGASNSPGDTRAEHGQAGAQSVQVAPACTAAAHRRAADATHAADARPGGKRHREQQDGHARAKRGGATGHVPPAAAGHALQIAVPQRRNARESSGAGMRGDANNVVFVPLFEGLGGLRDGAGGAGGAQQDGHGVRWQRGGREQELHDRQRGKQRPRDHAGAGAPGRQNNSIPSHRAGESAPDAERARSDRRARARQVLTCSLERGVSAAPGAVGTGGGGGGAVAVAGRELEEAVFRLTQHDTEGYVEKVVVSAL